MKHLVFFLGSYWQLLMIDNRSHLLRQECNCRCRSCKFWEKPFIFCSWLWNHISGININMYIRACTIHYTNIDMEWLFSFSFFFIFSNFLALRNVKFSLADFWQFLDMQSPPEGTIRIFHVMMETNIVGKYLTKVNNKDVKHISWRLWQFYQCWPWYVLIKDCLQISFLILSRSEQNN